jgi:hypothetical protein
MAAQTFIRWGRLGVWEAHELPQAIGLFGRLPDVPHWVVADRGYASHAFREHIWNHQPSAEG